MTRIAVLTPILQRAHRVAPLVASLEATSEPGLEMRLFFLCSPGDLDIIDAVVAAGQQPYVMSWDPGRGDYPRKINWGAKLAAGMNFDWFLCGADDLLFHPGWARAALAVHEQTGALVIGTNDLGNEAVMAGRFSTHPLVHRDYLAYGTIDEPGSGMLYHPGYDHNGCDPECCDTARARGTFAFAADSIVEHLHPTWGKAEKDDIYVRGRKNYDTDMVLRRQRKALWGATP